MASNMTVSTGEGPDKVSVKLNIPEPSTFDDPQWEAWNCGESDICALAVRQIRVDTANSLLRDELRDAVKRGVGGDALQALIQGKLDGWKRGEQRQAKRPTLDLRNIPGLTEEQVEGIREKNPDHDLILPEELK